MSVQRCPAREIRDDLEVADGTACFDAPRGLFAHAADQRQADPHARAVGARLKRGIPAAHSNVGRQHDDAMSLRILHELRGTIEIHRLAVEKRAQKGRRFMALEPGAGVDEQGEARRVVFRKAVLAEPLNLLKVGLNHPGFSGGSTL